MAEEQTLIETEHPTTHFPEISLASVITHLRNPSHVLLSHKIILHNPKAGLNPLVDAAAYLFSSIGKLKQAKSFRHLDKLHKELFDEINTFQQVTKACHYSAEYLLVSRYALCATIDDIILNSPWGTQGQWDRYSLLKTFKQDTSDRDRFFLLLDRIIKDPATYIDLMEFMYICLSLGFKGNYRLTEFNNYQLDQITETLYRHIRDYRGDFSKHLSPYPLRPPVNIKTGIKFPDWTIIVIAISAAIIVFSGIYYIASYSRHPALNTSVTESTHL